MKPKIIIITMLIGVLSTYIVGFIGGPFLFIFFPIALIILFFLAFLYILNNKNIYLTLLCSIFLFLGGWVVNHYFLSSIFHSIFLLGNVGILIFTLFLGWSFKKTHKKKKLLLGTALFIFFILLLSFITPKTHKPIAPSSIDALKALPYLTWVPAKKNIQKKGIIQYDQKQSFDGINIYSSRNLSEAYLMDMSGNVIHTWSAKINDNDSWHHIELCKNGDLLVIVKDKMLIRLDWNSNIKWVKKMRFHHDIAIVENEDIYVLARKEEVVFYYGVPIPILNDYIIVLSSDGKIKKEVSIYKMLKDENPFHGKFSKTYYNIIYPQRLICDIKEMIKTGRFLFKHDGAADIFHTNTIEILNKDIDGICQKGDILVSIRELDLIGILNIEQEKIVWKWGPGNLSKQHHPTILESNNILLFDNGRNKKRSRIIEINPHSNKIVWEYKRDLPEIFYSSSRGSSQRFSNGNTLITESNSGHVFEITKNGKIVWEFYNPQIRKKNKERAAIYRMMRITDLENYPRLRN